MVSDLFICLFEEEKWSKNNIYLMFWANLRSLVTIKKNAKEKLVKLFLKQKHKKSLYELELDFPDSDKLVGTIVRTMKNDGNKLQI